MPSLPWSKACPGDWDACATQFPTFELADFAVTGLLLLSEEPIAAGASVTRLGLPVAGITAALARLEAATVLSRDPRQWDPVVLAQDWAGRAWALEPDAFAGELRQVLPH